MELRDVTRYPGSSPLSLKCLLVLLSWPCHFKGHRIFFFFFRESHCLEFVWRFLWFSSYYILLFTQTGPQKLQATCCVVGEGGLEVLTVLSLPLFFWDYRRELLRPGLFPADENQTQDFEWWGLSTKWVPALILGLYLLSQWCIFLSMSCQEILDVDPPILETVISVTCWGPHLPALHLSSFRSHCWYSMVMLVVTFPAMVSFFWHAHWALCPGWLLQMLWHWVTAEAHLEGRAKSRCSFQSQPCLVCAIHMEGGARFYECVIQSMVLGSPSLCV